MLSTTARGARVGLLVLALAACGGGEGSTDDLSGAELAAEIGCLACHTEADTELAPTLHGIWDADVLLEDGRSVTVDEAYVRTSITDPGADIAAGYRARMPTFGLSQSEVDRLVDYVRSLS